MKRLLLTAALLTVMPAAVVLGDPTKTRGLTEYCEQSTRKLTECCEIYQIDSSKVFLNYFSNPFNVMNVLIMDTSTGSVWVHPDDLTIQSASATYYSPDDAGEGGVVNMIKCASMISALEYSAWEESVKRALDPTFNALNASIDILTNQIATNLTEEAIGSLLRSPGTHIPLYSGNYDYSAFSYTYDFDGGKRVAVSLEAEERTK